MSEERIERAVQRIEAALGRISAVSDNPAFGTGAGAAADLSADENAATPSIIALVEKHEALNETVSNTLEQLDKLIAELDA